MLTAKTQPNATANTYDFEFEALKEAANYRKSIIQAFSQYLKGNVIEIGAGIGQMTAEFLQLPEITRLLAVEPDLNFCLQHGKNLPRQELLHGIIQDVTDGVGWDAIVSINVLEHIEDHVAELRHYRTKLAARNGHVCVLVPARPEIYSPIDKDFGHFRRYTKKELNNCFQQAGFEIVTLEYFNLTGYFAWLWTFKIMRARHFAKDQVKLFDQHIFPVTQWLEHRFTSLPFGQSLIAVGRA